VAVVPRGGTRHDEDGDGGREVQEAKRIQIVEDEMRKIAANVVEKTMEEELETRKEIKVKEVSTSDDSDEWEEELEPEEEGEADDEESEEEG
jgi:hypothetical protein